MRKTIILFFLSALLLVACAKLPAQEGATPVEENPDQPLPAQTETPLPSTGAGQDKPSPVELPEGAVLVFHRSGGIAGVNEIWTVYADGRVTLLEGNQPEASTQQWQVDPEQVVTLLEKLDSLGFFTLQISGGPGDACCDRFAYSLAVAYQENSRELSAVEGASRVPDGYWQAVSEVEAFLKAASQ
jgi:hypothetical protein